MAFSGIEVWIGFYLMMILISYAILTSSKTEPRVKDDQDALQIAKEALENDEVVRYEVISIARMDDIQKTTVIVETDALGISLEIDNNSGKILNKEKLVG